METCMIGPLRTGRAGGHRARHGTVSLATVTDRLVRFPDQFLTSTGRPLCNGVLSRHVAR
jgi:hypothetical protein